MCSCDFQKYSAALGVHGKINTLTDECVHIYTHFIIFCVALKDTRSDAPCYVSRYNV